MKKIFSLLALSLVVITSVSAQKLLEAVDAKNYELVERFIKEGENPNVPAKNGQFPLWNALWNHDPKMVALLLKNGASATAHFKNKTGKTSLLEIAAQEGETEAAILLVDAGADADERGHVGHTPLRVASRNGHTALVKYFLSRGCEVDSKGRDGATPLEQAASKGHLDIVKLLLEAGADINMQDKEKDFPLGEAAKAGFGEVVEYLLSKGANTGLKNDKGEDATEMARLAGQAKIVVMLRARAGK